LDATFDKVQSLAHSKTRAAEDDSAARTVAKQLAHDIQAHLTETD
jgi:hypothetical protein